MIYLVDYGSMASGAGGMMNYGLVFWIIVYIIIAIIVYAIIYYIWKRRKGGY